MGSLLEVGYTIGCTSREEHTCYAFIGYMEGALNSGYRIARRLAVRDPNPSCVARHGTKFWMFSCKQELESSFHLLVALSPKLSLSGGNAASAIRRATNRTE